MRPPGVTQEFAELYPAVGKIEPGAHWSPEQAAVFTGIIATRVGRIKYAAQPTPLEVTFIDHTADMASRNLIYCLEQKHMGLSNIDKAESLIKQAEDMRLANTRTIGIDDIRERLVAAAGAISRTRASARQIPSLRLPLGCYATTALTVFKDVVATAEGIDLDLFLAMNTINIIDSYNQVSKNSQ